MPNQETTPLLSDDHVLPLHAGALKDQNPSSIDFDTSHSVWPWLSQRALLFLRGGILVYLTAITPVLFQYKVAENTAKDQTPWSLLFDFSATSHTLQWMWLLMSFVSLPLSPLQAGVDSVFRC